MPDKSYIQKQLNIAGDEKYPQKIREDALCRAVSNSNIHGFNYPNIQEIGAAHVSILQAFIDGKIDLNEIQERAEGMILGGILDE
ncbi:hypothetical protein [Mastigocoleus testarum]|uniref:Uncharacterized protein n=1 Tax=Mastigocoleus testarum BC008 TaxID=371196 RepID=A0A0V7ZG57_9CYAN|nr:hypothetical protein [Mastigocoleus testarum]KST63523.1 hypothetical protein BC008_13750 [Mastigocoleus testarum BC008]